MRTFKCSHVFSGMFCAFPLHSHRSVVSLSPCSLLCLTTPGCYSFNFRYLEGSTRGQCVIVTPSAGGSINFEVEDDWYLYSMLSLIGQKEGEWVPWDINTTTTNGTENAIKTAKIVFYICLWLDQFFIQYFMLISGIFTYIACAQYKSHFIGSKESTPGTSLIWPTYEYYIDHGVTCKLHLHQY